MSRKKQNRIDTGGDNRSLENNPFASLNMGADLPAGSVKPKVNPPAKKPKKGMRLDVRLEKSGRGGKIVTAVYGVAPLGDTRKKEILLKLKKKLGTGGTISSNSLEIQGDNLSSVMELLEKEGFQPVKTGG